MIAASVFPQTESRDIEINQAPFSRFSHPLFLSISLLKALGQKLNQGISCVRPPPIARLPAHSLQLDTQHSGCVSSRWKTWEVVKSEVAVGENLLFMTTNSCLVPNCCCCLLQQRGTCSWSHWLTPAKRGRAKQFSGTQRITTGEWKNNKHSWIRAAPGRWIC